MNRMERRPNQRHHNKHKRTDLVSAAKTKSGQLSCLLKVANSVTSLRNNGHKFKQEDKTALEKFAANATEEYRWQHQTGRSLARIKQRSSSRKQRLREQRTRQRNSSTPTRRRRDAKFRAHATRQEPKPQQQQWKRKPVADEIRGQQRHAKLHDLALCAHEAENTDRDQNRSQEKFIGDKMAKCAKSRSSPSKRSARWGHAEAAPPRAQFTTHEKTKATGRMKVVKHSE